MWKLAVVFVVPSDFGRFFKYFRRVLLLSFGFCCNFLFLFFMVVCLRYSAWCLYSSNVYSEPHKRKRGWNSGRGNSIQKKKINTLFLLINKLRKIIVFINYHGINQLKSASSVESFPWKSILVLASMWEILCLFYQVRIYISFCHLLYPRVHILITAVSNTCL